MRQVDLVQNSIPWLAWRDSGLGASDAATIIGVSPFKTSLRLWEERTGHVKRQEASYKMRRGLRFEPMVRKWYESRVGHAMPPLCCEHDTHSFLKASLDGFDLVDGTILEIKAPNQLAHAESIKGQVPAYYLPQLYHQLIVTGAERVHYVSYTEHRAFRDDQRFALVEVLPDREAMDFLLFREWCFWGMIILHQWWNLDSKYTLPIPKALKVATS